MIPKWRQPPSGSPNPVGKRGAIEMDALAGIDLRLPVQGEMIGVLGHQDMRDQSLGRDAAFDNARRRGRLHDRALAGAAALTGSPRHRIQTGIHTRQRGIEFFERELELIVIELFRSRPETVALEGSDDSR
jgi:hypothetical protein